jgi:integrase
LPKESTTTKTAKTTKKRNRRGHGEGSIYQRKSDGLWVGSLLNGTDFDGNYKRPTVYGKTQKEVIAKLDALKEKKNKGQLANKTKVSLNDLIEHWLEFEMKPPKKAEGTYLKYKINYETHIKDSIGKPPVQKLKRPAIVEFLSEKEDTLAPETVKILLSIIRRVIEIALIDEIIHKSPLLGVKRTKKVEKKKRRALTPDEEKKILETALAWSQTKNYNPHVYNILLTEYGSGLRRSEVLPLKKSDINFTTRELSVQRVYLVVDKKAKLEERAKTEASQEAIVLPELIAKHLESIPTAEAPNDYLFPGEGGLPIYPNSFRLTFKRILKKAGVDESIRLHDLRHNYASQLVALNVHIAHVQAQMRHTDIKTTSRYTHTSTDGQRDAAAKMNDHIQALLPTPKASDSK